MTLYDLIVKSASVAISLQREDGSMPAGHNGPYHHPETPVRNTSHWLISFLKAFEVSGEGHFADAGRRAAEYLCSREARPFGATFWHRTQANKDSCNGLIGQAWTIEALAAAAQGLGDARCSKLAESVFLLHPFEEKLGLWRRVDTDGSRLGFDPTFNHQLWFAAAGALLLPTADGHVEQRITRFLDLLPVNMGLYRSGLVRHAIKRIPASSKAEGIRRVIRGLIPGRSVRASPVEMFYRSIGYHAFNLYGLALLRHQTGQHWFWQSKMFGDALHFVDNKEYVRSLEDNKFGFPYNPPGFEVAYALHVFSDKLQLDAGDKISVWVARQLQRCYDFEAHRMSLGTEDPTTHSARLYEATRLPNVEVRVEDLRVAG